MKIFYGVLLIVFAIFMVLYIISGDELLGILTWFCLLPAVIVCTMYIYKEVE